MICFQDPTIADAIMERVIPNSYILALDSKKSMREVIAEKIIKNIEKMLKSVYLYGNIMTEKLVFLHKGRGLRHERV